MRAFLHRIARAVRLVFPFTRRGLLLSLLAAAVLAAGVLRADLALLVGMTVLALSTREFGLTTLFVMGVQADLFGSARFGLLTLCYLLAAGVILLIRRVVTGRREW